MKRRTLTVTEYTQVVGVSKTTAYSAARRGEIPGLIRIGRRFMIARSAVAKLLGEDLEPSEGQHTARARDGGQE